MQHLHNMYPRIVVDNLKSWMDSREILILYGARQVGKTTLLKMFLKNFCIAERVKSNTSLQKKKSVTISGELMTARK